MLFFLGFGLLNDSKVPVEVYNATFAAVTVSSGDNSSLGDTVVGPETQQLTYKLDFFNYVPVVLGFLGWCLFVMFAGIGLIALPFDLIMDFFYQPKLVRL